MMLEIQPTITVDPIIWKALTGALGLLCAYLMFSLKQFLNRDEAFKKEIKAKQVKQDEKITDLEKNMLLQNQKYESITAIISEVKNIIVDLKNSIDDDKRERARDEKQLNKVISELSGAVKTFKEIVGSKG